MAQPRGDRASDSPGRGPLLNTQARTCCSEVSSSVLRVSGNRVAASKVLRWWECPRSLPPAPLGSGRPSLSGVWLQTSLALPVSMRLDLGRTAAQVGSPGVSSPSGKGFLKGVLRSLRM